MKYSKLHRQKNPISAARLDEAFKASTMEGGPGDPEKVKIDKNKTAGEVTITRTSEGAKPTVSIEEAYKNRGKNYKDLSIEEYKKEVDDYNKSREQKSSFTYKKLKGLDRKIDFPVENEDLTFDPTEYIPDEYRNPPGDGSNKITYSTTEKEKKKSKDKPEEKKIKDDGLSECDPNNNKECVAPIGDQSKKSLKAAENKRKLEEKAGRKRDRKIERGELNPKKWFEEKMSERSQKKAMNQTTASRRKKDRQANKASKRRMKGKPPTKNPLSRTIAGQF
jgi:hypothetical protein